MFWWYAVCEGMQHWCDWSTTTCTPLPWPQRRPYLLWVSNCNPVPEPSWATMVTRRSRCLWTPSKAKSTSKMCKLMSNVVFNGRIYIYIIRIHPQGHLQVHPCKDTIQHNMNLNWLVPQQWLQETGQPTQQTYQATPAPWPPSSLSGVLQVWLPPTRLPSKDGRGWLWMAYSPISCFPHRALLELAEHQCCWIQVIHGLSQLLMSEANERFTSSIIWSKEV